MNGNSKLRQTYRRSRMLMRELLALRAERGPYRFLVGRWGGISDIDLAIGVLGTEFFRGDLKPVLLPIEKVRSILVLAPHQDDEVIGAGGSLLIASAAGVDIDVLYITDGTKKGPGSASTSAETAIIRNREAQEICSKLDANMHQLGISNSIPKPTLDDLDRLSGIIRDLKPQVLMVPWILDSPAKHRLVNHLLWLAHQRNGLPDCEVWGFQVHNTLLPNGYIDITDVAEQKRKLIECYRSQNELKMRYDHLAMGLAAWNSRLFNSTVPKFIELFFTLPLHEHLHLIESFYFSDLNVTYRGHSDVIPGALEIHKSVMEKSRKSKLKGLMQGSNESIQIS